MDIEQLSKEVIYKTSRSSGAGGQNVNKVETKVTLLWDYISSNMLSQQAKEVITIRLSNRLQADGWLQVDSSTSRSQLQNKTIALKKMFDLVTQALKPKAKRIATKVSFAKNQERLDKKTKHSNKKLNRKWRSDD